MSQENLEIDRRSAIQTLGGVIAGGGLLRRSTKASAKETEDEEKEVNHIYAALYPSNSFYELHRDPQDPDDYKDIERIESENTLQRVLEAAKREGFPAEDLVLSDDIRTLWLDEEAQTAQYYLEEDSEHPTLDVSKYRDIHDRLYLPGSDFCLRVKPEINSMKLAHNLLYGRMKQHFASIKQGKGKCTMSMTLPAGADYTVIQTEDREIVNEHNTEYEKNGVEYATYTFLEKVHGDVKVISGSDDVKFVIRPEKMY